MISFDDYRTIYHSNVKNEHELKHLSAEFDEQIELLKRINPAQNYSKEELKDILFAKKISSQTTFYRMRRGLVRLAAIMGFDFRIVHKINTIEFEDVFKSEDFSTEYFASIDELCNEVLVVQKASPDNDRTGSLAVVCLLWDGLMFADVTRLRIEDVNFDNNSISISGINGKTKTISMSKATSSALREYMKSKTSVDGFVFVGPSGTRAHKTTTNKMIISMNDFSNKKFISKNITYSGWFWRVYNNKQDEEFPTKDIRIKYNKWVECFCGNSKR